MKEMLSNTLKLNFGYLKIIHILHQRYHPKIIGNIIKYKQKKQVCLYLWDYTINHNENGLHRYDINRPGSRHGHKYSKFNNCLSMMVVYMD